MLRKEKGLYANRPCCGKKEVASFLLLNIDNKVMRICENHPFLSNEVDCPQGGDCLLVSSDEIRKQLNKILEKGETK